MVYYNNSRNNMDEVSRNAKFNLGMSYSQTIHNQTLAIDRAFAAADINAMVTALRTLFRQASPKLTNTEKKEFKTQFSKLSPLYQTDAELKDQLKNIQSNFQSSDPLKRSISINKNKIFAVLEDIDIFLRKLLENHKLLIPDVKESASLFE